MSEQNTSQENHNESPYRQYAYAPEQEQSEEDQKYSKYADNPFKLFEHLLPQEAKNAVRGMYGVIGLAAIVLGAALLLWPVRTAAVAAALLGIYFIIAGVVRVVSAVVELGLPAGWRVLDVLVGILQAVGGVLVLKNATLSGATLMVFVAVLIGMGWIMEGVVSLAESWHMPSSGWAVFYAIVSIFAGFVALVSPLSSAFWLMVFAGIALIVTGIASCIRALRFGK